MITSAGLDAIERVIAEHPNVFGSVARESLEWLLEHGRTLLSLEADIVSRSETADESVVAAARLGGFDPPLTLE